jgi:hypothetical protein
MKLLMSYRLRDFPTPVKALALGYVLALGVGYMYALSNIALVIGLSPKQIAVHYYGSAEKIPEQSTKSGEESLDLDNMKDQKAENVVRPSLKNLVSEGHFHLFGMTSFFFGLTLLGLFTSVGETKKTLMVFIPYLAIIFDNFSFLVTRFVGPKFSYLTAISGAIMGLSFAALWFAIVYEVIQKGESTK